MSNYPKLTNYVSEIDQFLQMIDKQFPLPSLSQQKEIAKYKRIHFLRSHVVAEEQPNVSSLWKKF